jgi:hypothetical protein
VGEAFVSDAAVLSVSGGFGLSSRFDRNTVRVGVVLSMPVIGARPPRGRN